MSRGPLASIEAVYVLSVKTFDRRIAHARAELARHGIAFEFVFEHDIPDLDAATLTARFGASNLPLPAKSLVLKHLQAWTNAGVRGQGRIMVFEDDVLLDAEFSARLATAMAAADALRPGWLVYLGGADTKVPDAFFLEPRPLMENPIATTEGYVTDLAACRARVAWCEKNFIDLPSDHLLRRVDPQIGVLHYWLPQAIVEQGSVTGLFDSVLDDSRRKHSRFYNVARNRWNKLQRRKLRRLWVRTAGLLGRRARSGDGS